MWEEQNRVCMHAVWVFPDAGAEMHLIKLAEENKQARQETGQKTDADSVLLAG